LSSQSSGTRRKIDVIFLSPPWGGPEYLSGSPSIKEKPSDPSAMSTSGSSDGEAHPEYHLSSVQPIHGAELFKLSRGITGNIAYYLPRNTKLEEISDLLNTGDTKDLAMDEDEKDPLRPCHEGELAEERQGEEKVEVEEEWMGTKLKALTCYFGGLTRGQEDLF
jgi:trimethylguanosine synthase